MRNYKYFVSSPISKNVSNGEKSKDVIIRLLSCNSTQENLIYLMILQESHKVFSRDLDRKEISTRYGGNAHNFMKVADFDTLDPIIEYVQDLNNNNFLAPLNLEDAEIRILINSLVENIQQGKEYETAINDEITSHKTLGQSKSKIIKAIEYYKT